MGGKLTLVFAAAARRDSIWREPTVVRESGILDRGTVLVRLGERTLAADANWSFWVALQIEL